MTAPATLDARHSAIVDRVMAGDAARVAAGERRFEIRDVAGQLQAIHVRRDTPTGKVMSWRGAGGSSGLAGRRADSLPLYGSERVPTWPLDTWIVVAEGESDTDALAAAGVPALGTVTGATAGVGGVAAPTPEALAGVAEGRKFIVWPDNDEPGRRHGVATGSNLHRAGAVAVRTIDYRSDAAPWPTGAGARDVIGRLEPAVGAALVAWLIEDWSRPAPRPGPLLTVRAPRPAPARARDTGSVSEALVDRGILNARPGRTVRCPAHEDRQPSLSVLADDRRAICKSAGCSWSGRGVIAADIVGMVSA